MKEQQTPEKEEQTLTSHLVELRERLIRTLLIILAIFLGLFYIANDHYTYFSAPQTQNLPENS
ncbi:MAG: Sec-independent protein translocase subunit TatC, partial [Pseudomonadales bacterium]|nr:Sec-independent protein translocase subunit TatC [Pseudomonadales bacterium]